MSSKPAIEVQSGAVPMKVDVGGTESLFDRAKEIYNAVAQRAYELFEGRNHEDGYDVEDWLRAEREFFLPVPIEATEYDDHFAVRAEVPGFNEKEIQVSLEPRRLIISGKIEQTDERKEGETTYTSRRYNEFFHTLDLPAEVNPAEAKATLKNGILDIQLPRVAQAESARVEVKAE